MLQVLCWKLLAWQGGHLHWLHCWVRFASRRRGASSVCKICDAGWWSPGNMSTCTVCGVCPYWKFSSTVFFQPLTLSVVLTQNVQKFQFTPNSVDGRMFMGMGPPFTLWTSRLGCSVRR